MLSNNDGLFAARPLAGQMNAFRLVGSAFAAEKELENRRAKASCHWRIPAAILQFDLY